MGCKNDVEVERILTKALLLYAKQEQIMGTDNSLDIGSEVE